MWRIGKGLAGALRYRAAAVLVLCFAAAVASKDQGHIALASGDGETERAKPRLPDFPPGVDLDANVARAKAMRSPAEFIRLVEAEGAWDFRWQGFGQSPNPYAHSGHFHYGVMSRALGLPEWLAKRAAAMKQVFGE